MSEQVEIAALLHAEATTDEPPSSVLDVKRAMSVGRRQRRYGRAACAGLVVAVLAAGAVTVPRVLPARGTAGYDVAGLPAVSALPTMSGDVAPPSFDPLKLYLKFGWVPGRYDQRSYEVGATGQGMMAVLMAYPVVGHDWQGVSVTLYPRGVTPPPPQRLVGRATVTRTIPASVNGQDANWTVYSGATIPEAFLDWRYAPQGWARIQVTDANADVADIAVRVAEKLQVSTTTSVTVPFRVGALPSGLRRVSTSINSSTQSDDSPWYAEMAFSAGRTEQQREDERLIVNATAYRDQDRVGGKGFDTPNTTIDGHPTSQIPPSGPTSDLTVYHIGLMNLEVEASTLGVAGLLGPEGCRSVYPRLNPVPGNASSVISQLG
ncbi:hypothetical protein [Rugosimonospora africana]|uniref:Uncharacterized protein n=1 Tax=Rugosimonospora africana TaxID=556532 RepID=A0A8J3QUL2_9ACTN|nr:hypothetical protein [Rugosimonospora africana]GIH16784.1 hypothetical protein Raf01_49560 [Rugosimonospora africana]